MNKKQLRISLVILGVFAVVVICIGLFKGTSSNKTDTAYDAELVKQLESLGDMDLASITNFKDGLYPVDNNYTAAVNLEFTDMEKIGNNIHIHSNIDGDKKYICRVSESIKYDKATTYDLHCVEVNCVDEIKSVGELINKVKSLEIKNSDIIISECKYKLKVTDSGDIRLNDILLRKYSGNDIEYEGDTTDEEVQKVQDEYTKAAEELNKHIINETPVTDTSTEEGVTVNE